MVFSELHIFTESNFVVTLRYGQIPDLPHVRRVLERTPEELGLGSEAVPYAGFAQNQEVKKISVWAAIVFAPTLIAGIYGMNVVDIPLLHNTWGFEYSMGMMGASSFAVWLNFKRKR